MDREGDHTGDNHNDRSNSHCDALEVASTFQDFAFFLPDFWNSKYNPAQT